MKAYKLELLVIDFDQIGGDSIKDVIENACYPNDCINPSVESIQEADIGVWSDDHPLNKRDTARAEYARLFAASAPSPAVAMEPVAQMICPSCGKNRFKETCPSDGHCPMIADAHSATPSPSLAVRDVVVDDLAMLVRRLVRSLEKSNPGTDLAPQALDYLKRKGLQGSPLRDEKPNADCSGEPANCPDNEGYGCACDPMNKSAMREKP